MNGEPQQAQPSLPLPPWERARKRPGPARIPLTRERIVDAAYVVLDREGYDRLSMRQVATELGVAVSALYAHVRSKDELLELMYNRLFEGWSIPDPDPDRWQEQIKDYARESRARLTRHRDMARISMTQVPFTRELLPYVERLLAIFRAAGLPDPVAAIAGDMLSTYIDGFAFEESIWEERRGDTSAESWDALREQMEKYFGTLPPDRFPNMVALSPLMLNESNDQRFDRGLDIIVRGLASYARAPGEH
jgi:AcrR family transcriptional regulator